MTKKESYLLTLIDINFFQKIIIIDKTHPLASSLYDLFKKQDWFSAFFNEDFSDIETYMTIPVEDQKYIDQESIKLRGGVYGLHHLRTFKSQDETKDS